MPAGLHPRRLRATWYQANNTLPSLGIRCSRVGQIWFEETSLYSVYPRASRLLAYQLMGSLAPPIQRKVLNMNISPRASTPIRNRSRSVKSRGIPKWETKLTAAIADGLIANDVLKISSAIYGKSTYTTEFELLGGLLVRVESRPSPKDWGAVDISIVVEPNPDTGLNQRPGEVLPIMTPKGLRQGQVTALSTIHFGQPGTPYIALLYVNRFFPKRWQHVCGL